MIHLIQREFIVEAPLAIAWRHLAQVENWPAWAKHIKRLKLFPPGELTPQSHGMIYLRHGVRSDFRVTEFNRHRNWKWAEPFLWLIVHYDHRFETFTDGRTKITFIIDCAGFGASTLGKLFAAIYRHNLAKAIPRLITAINESKFA